MPQLQSQNGGDRRTAQKKKKTQFMKRYIHPMYCASISHAKEKSKSAESKSM